MNCHEARTILDATHAGRDLPGSEASLHAQECESCRSWLEASAAFDAWVTPAFQDTDVPVGLREQILQSLGLAELHESPQQAESPSRLAGTTLASPAAVVRTRWRIWSSASLAVVLVVTACWWSWSRVNSHETLLAVETVESLLDEQFAVFNALPVFDGTFTPEMPQGNWSRWIVDEPRGIDLNDRGGHDAVVYRFTTQGGRFGGYLIVVARDRVSDPPSVTIPHSSTVRYRAPQRVTWTSEGQVCLCYLDQGRMEDFLQSLYRGST